MGDELLDLDDFNADRTPGPRKVMLDRLARDTGLGRREAYALLVACDWDEDTARRAIQGRLFG